MSTTADSERLREQQRQQEPQPGAEHRPEHGLPSASLPESLTVLVTGVVPALIRGLFSPRRRAMKLLSALDTDARAIKTLSKLRGKHGGDGIRLLGGRIAVLWGAPAIQEVLDHSAERYAGDAGAKAKGMSHFQPDALTLSRGEVWRNRRKFNEAVLATSEWVHPFARRFLAVVADEVEVMGLEDHLEWNAWERLFDHITLRVIFGDKARDDQRLTALLEKLMGEANRLLALKTSNGYYEFYGELERHLRDPEPESLIARFAEAPHDPDTRVVQQIPHWMFAMRDTLGANAFRALAAIVSDERVALRVREELRGADLSDPAGLDAMRYLEGCLQEAMRLWPTTPLLARETIGDTTLAGEQLSEGTQVMLLNVFNHRDPDHVADADRLTPDRWQDRPRDYRFNHLSNGTQDCPGGPLVLLLGKAVLAQILDAYELKLERPAIKAGEPLPKMLDFFDICFRARRRRPQ
jgi:cytochrome P450